MHGGDFARRIHITTYLIDDTLDNVVRNAEGFVQWK